MKIEINLKNPKYCDGCPCMGWTDCANDKWCLVDGGMNTIGYIEYIPRPQQCIDKYGE